jgi:protein-arginine kinase activator protein McsA
MILLFYSEKIKYKFILLKFGEKMMKEKDFNGDKLRCDICGKTLKDVLHHNNQRVCKECYTNIINE